MKLIIEFIKSAIIFILYCLIIGFPLMWLWNAILPELFGFKLISFWQALGLSALSKMLFGNNKSSSD